MKHQHSVAGNPVTVTIEQDPLPTNPEPSQQARGNTFPFSLLVVMLIVIIVVFIDCKRTIQ